MNIVPEHKHDFETCERLKEASDEEVIPCLPQLLEWLQDINWPVAFPVIKRIKTMGPALVEPVRSILRSDDGIWKYWILAHLLPVAGSVVFEALREDLLKLAHQPTPGDVQDEVNLAARDLLEGFSPPQTPASDA